MAPLRYAAKFDPFLFLDCAPTRSTLAQSEGIKFCHLATLCEGDLCNANEEEGYVPPHLLPRTSSEHHPLRKPGAAVAATPDDADAYADVIAT